MRQAAIVILLAALLAACGQKGALYLPVPEALPAPAVEQMPSDASASADKTTESLPSKP
jgi:predicted small lipoprotein YifL